MGPLVDVHVDQLDGLPGPREGPLRDGRAVPEERDDGPVVVRVELHVEDPDPGHGPDRGGDRVHDLAAPPFGEVRHALDEFPHGGPGPRADGPCGLKRFPARGRRAVPKDAST